MFDADREIAGTRYEELRVRLIRFFEWRGCTDAHDLADICLDRVLRKIGEGEEINNVQAFAATVAQYVYKEDLRSRGRMTDSIDADDAPRIAAEETVSNDDDRMDCLESCLNEFNVADRDLIISYYNTDEKTMIAARKRLADSLNVSINTLRIKVCRLKTKLERCTKKCCDQA